MQVRGLEDTDKHEGVASPGADDLDSPALPDSREDSIVFATAITDVPENVAACIALSDFILCPRREGQARGRACIW